MSAPESNCQAGEPPTVPLRTSEVAAAVNVHPNTVRLYEEWGYLPPIPRTASGYRQFNRRHVAQMQLARLAFTDPYPGRLIRRSLANVVRVSADGDYAAAQAAAGDHRALVLRELKQSQSAADYLQQWVSGATNPDVLDQHLLSGETAALLDVTKDTLRHWERNGLIDPPRDQRNGYRMYGSGEIGRLRVLRLLTRAGYSTMAVLRMVRALDEGRRVNLASLLDTPGEDEEIFYAADRWLTTLHEHDKRALAIMCHLREMTAMAASAE